jgi:predicted enzyme related to lactoylglutathione lyase
MDKVTSFNIPVNDMKRAKKFYGDIFGWVLTPTGMRYDYHTVTTVNSDEKNQPKEAGAINGALYDRDGGDDGIRLSIKVKSMDEVLKGVRALGGNVMHDKMEVPGRGYFAEIGDTEGNVLMLWQDA